MVGNGLVLPNGLAATAYPPGYPLLLAGLFTVADMFRQTGDAVVAMFGVVAMIATAILFFTLARTLFSSGWAFLATAAWITYPFALWATKQPNSEIAFLPFFYGSLLLVWQQRWKHSLSSAFLCGILAGCAMLIRPAAMGLPVVYAILLWWWSRKSQTRLLPTLAIFFAGTALLVVPWLAWLYQETHRFVLMSTNGVPSIRDGLTFAVELKEYRLPMTLPADVDALMNQLSTRMAMVESIKELVTGVIAIAVEHPLATVKLFLWKAVRSWYATDSHRLELGSALIQIIYLTTATLGGLVAWRLRDKWRDYVIFTLLLVLYFWVTTISVLSILRYMMPVMGLLIILSTLGMRKILERLLRRINHTMPSEKHHIGSSS
jgi:4-amino-4-deoxy-L-arabinose transferase-like glycosyltransferase